jgi:hypothetical protein
MADDWDGRERRKKSQWSIDSWSALQSAATLLMMAVAGLVWGLKLEGRIDLIGTTHKADMDKLEGKVLMVETATQKGILPVTEVRMNGLKSEIDALRRDVDECATRKR